MALLVTSPGDSLQLCRVQFRKLRAKCCHLENLVVNEAPSYTFSYRGQVLTCSPPLIVERYSTTLLHPDDTVTYRYMPYGRSVREVWRPALVNRRGGPVKTPSPSSQRLATNKIATSTTLQIEPNTFLMMNEL